MNEKILEQNKSCWNAIADDWFGSTALPTYGIYLPTESDLHLLGELKGKKILDIGCGSGHFLLYCANNGASDLWGVDLSSTQLKIASKLLRENSLNATLINSPMEQSDGIPTDYFDIVYSIYAIGWTLDLQRTFQNINSYLKKDGKFVFSWDHPFMHCVDIEGDKLIFSGDYNTEDLFSFEKGGYPVTLINRKMSTYINALADSGFCVEKVIETTDYNAVRKEGAFHSEYYSPIKASHFPLSFIIKARKL
ncbi:MAG: class I SAM-dependent methyltransferase [Candidatus Fimenecus sp.]